MENPQASVVIRTPSEEEKPRTQSLGRFDRRPDAADQTSISTMVPARNARGSASSAPCDRHWRLCAASNRSGRRGPERAPIARGGVDDRQRLERDLYDGVQNQLVALIVKLALAQEDPETPPALAHMLADFEAHAHAALHAVRNIARGIYPPQLTDFGPREALRAQAMRGAIRVNLAGTAPRSREQAEEPVYFSCAEAIQNAARHAGHTVHVTLRLDHHHETLRVRIADDGRGFDPARTPEGAGLQNIRDRIEGSGGSFKVASRQAFGTVLTISLPWPTAADGRR